MTGLLALVLGIDAIAGLSAFLIAYDEALHHLPHGAAARHSVVTALGAAAFFAAVGIGLVLLLFR